MCCNYELDSQFFLSTCLCRRQYMFGDFQKQLQCFKNGKKIINIDFIKRMANMLRHKQVAAKSIYLAGLH